jgi:G-protein alpha subunit
MHCFDNVNGIIFLCNLAGYNTVLFEDPSVNRMKECYELFKKTVNNTAFESTPFYLLFNKKDMFEQKLRTDPLTVCECFESYIGGQEDTVEALKYIETAFRVRSNSKFHVINQEYVFAFLENFT